MDDRLLIARTPCNLIISRTFIMYKYIVEIYQNAKKQNCALSSKLKSQWKLKIVLANGPSSVCHVHNQHIHI